MPRGAKPKVYPVQMVSEVKRLYELGRTQAEIADELCTTQKVVWRLMLRSGIVARTAAKRDQTGDKNDSWRGDCATYAALHLRVQTARGTPSRCAACDSTDSPRFEWANLTGDYANVHDYIRLCRSCHNKFDGIAVNLGEYLKTE